MSTTSATVPTAPAHRPGRAAHVALWVGQVIVALALATASIPKVTLDPATVEGFAALGFGTTGTVVLGCLEIAGTIGLLVPRLAGFTALCALALMVGAVSVTLAAMPAVLAIYPAVIGVVAALVAYGRRHRTVELARTLRAAVTG